MHIWRTQLHVCMLNMKFLFLTLCQGVVRTNANNADVDINDDANNGQSMTVQGSLVDKLNGPKSFTIGHGTKITRDNWFRKTARFFPTNK